VEKLTENQDTKRFLGIISDGSTDEEILFGFTNRIFGKEDTFELVSLSQKLRDGVDAYKRECSYNSLGLCSNTAEKLRNKIITIIFSAINEFGSQIYRNLTSNDILVLSTDAESKLKNPEDYFKEEWCALISKIFYISLERFYHLAKYNFPWKDLPLILPLLFFPSTDIIIAAARTEINSIGTIHGLKASELKQKIYGVTNLSYLNEGDFKKYALDYITPESIKLIYNNVPEVRLFVQTIK